MSTQALTDICIHQPASIAALADIKSINPGVARKSGEAILDILKSSSADNDVEPIWIKFTPLDGEQRKRVKEIMNRLKSIAVEGCISQSILANRNDIEALVSGKKNIPLLQGWRYEFAGKQLLTEFV